MRQKLESLKPAFISYSSIFTSGSPRLGLFLAFITLLHPNLGLCGLLALFIASAFLCSLNPSLSLAHKQPILRNCLLIGLVFGDLFAFNFPILVFLTLFIFLTILVTAATDSLFSKQHLPILSLPFCLVALIIFLLLPNLYKFSTLPEILWNIDITAFLPNCLIYFSHAMSSLLCITNPSIGLLFWLAILLTSPLSALFLLVGFFIGTSFESLLHSVHHELFLYSEGYNYSLVFTAIAGVFMVPSRLSLMMATLATAITSVLVVISGNILNPWSLPILSLPFNLVILTILLSLKTLRPLALNQIFFESPEQNIETSNLSFKRHRFGEIGIFLPVAGAWKIQQAFNGNLTHRGFWQHALDFVAVDENGEIFKNKGLDLTDHFSFGKDILSPIEGVVVACLSSDQDNDIGQVSNGRNWGNYIIIKSAYGFYVTLSHLKKHSVMVSVGDFVNVGQKLAEVGNSGYCQEPHLHIQVQYSPEIGAKTAPFHLINYAINNQIHFHRTPLVNEILHSLNFNRAIEKTLNFKVAEKMIFKSGKYSQVTITSEVDELTGAFYLTDGISKLYHARIGAQFYFYGLKGTKRSALWDLLAAAPKIPIIYGAEFEYFDELPLSLTRKTFCKFFSHILQIIGLKPQDTCGKYKINKQGLEISGSHKFASKEINTFFKIDPALGIQEFASGEKKYCRIN